MGVRETLNERPRLAALLGVGLLAVAVPLVIWANSGPGGRVTKAYYTDDSGKTFFEDHIDKVYPFDRNGKPAYRAYVYECPGEKPFVAYLARYTDGAKAKLADLEAKSGDPEAAGQIAQLRNTAIEVRKPDSDKWFPLLSAQGGGIASHPTCKDGSVATLVTP